MNIFARTFWSFSIKRKMILSYLAVLLLPSLCIGFITYRSAGEELRSQLLENANGSVNTVNDIVTGSLTAKFSDLAYYANSVSAADADKGSTGGGQNLSESLVQYVNTHYDVLDIYLISESGVSLHGADKASSKGNIRSEEVYTAAVTNPGKTYVSPVFQTSAGQNSVSISRGLSDGKGIVGMDLNLESLAALTDLKVGKDGYVILLDSTHHYIVHPGYDDIGKEETAAFIIPLYASDSGTFSYSYEGSDREMVFATNNLTGWKIGGTIYREEITGIGRQIGLTTLWVILAAVVLGGLLIFGVTRSILKPIVHLKQTTSRIGQGYLNERLKTSAKDEIGDLSDNFQRMVDNLKDTILMVRDTSEGLSLSAEKLSSGAEQSKQSISQVTEAIQEVASGGEKQLTSMESGADNVRNLVDEVTEMAGEIGEVHLMMNVTSQLAQEGNESVAATNSRMESIHLQAQELDKVIKGLTRRTEEISGIVTVIAGIAQQTNLLALNASIEAARAGEQGRGFAVVAAEVRKLAENSAAFAEQIRGRIESITEEINGAQGSMEHVAASVREGIHSAQASETAFNHILHTVHGLAKSIERSSAKLQHMKEEAGSVDLAISQVQQLSRDHARNTETISASAEEQLAMAQEVAVSTEELKKKADELNALISRFTIE